MKTTNIKLGSKIKLTLLLLLFSSMSLHVSADTFGYLVHCGSIAGVKYTGGVDHFNVWANIELSGIFQNGNYLETEIESVGPLEVYLRRENSVIESNAGDIIKDNTPPQITSRPCRYIAWSRNTYIGQYGFYTQNAGVLNMSITAPPIVTVPN